MTDVRGPIASTPGLFDAEQLAQCVQCGFCLSSCPTYELTHLEEHGPRGRILAMRLVQEGELSLDDAAVRDSLETCVQCRACEAVCPSLVEFGSLMETARAELATRRPPRGLRGIAHGLGFAALRRPAVLRAGAVLLAVAQLLRLDRVLPSRARPRHRVRLAPLLRPLAASGAAAHAAGEATLAARGDAFLFRGCVMDVLFRDVHLAVADVLTALGYTVRTDVAPPCCGALQAHSGRADEAHGMAAAVVAAYAGTEGPIVVDSAGCGGAMKEYGALLGTDEARAFSARVVDLAEVVDPAELRRRGHDVALTAAYQAPCHLRNVQRSADTQRALLAAVPGLELREPDDEQLCCGSGGIYSMEQPELGDAMLARKDASLRRTGAPVVISGNPGCSMQIARAGWEVVHPAQVLARALVPDERAR